MKTPRETRTSETRINEMRETYEMDYISPLSLPRGVAKEGYVYRWVSRHYKGEENFRIEEMAAQGWTIVPSDRASKVDLDPLNRNPLSKQYFCYKDLILMELPEVYAKQRDARFNEMNANKIKSLRGVSNDMGNFTKSLPSINSF